MQDLINKFLQFNKNCPICNEPLTLYMQCMDKSIWKALLIDDQKKTYRFEPYKLTNSPFTKSDYMLLKDNKTSISVEFVGTEQCKKQQNWGLNFFFMCNKSGFEINSYSFNINPYFACYYRSSQWMKLEYKPLSSPGDNCTILPFFQGKEDLVNTDESFSFKRISTDLTWDRTYILNFDHENSKTKLFYYDGDLTQRDQENYSPKVFDKEIPPLTVRPNFADREKFLDRLDNWIMMS